MTLLPLPFDVSYSFDADLRETPHDRAVMAQAVAHLAAQLADLSPVSRERARTLGLVGVYARILGDFATAHAALEEACVVSERLGDRRLHLVNELRVAHVYQWQRRFDISDARFAALERCAADPELRPHLDFACQHAGKNLFDQGRYEEAERLFVQALELRRARGDQELIDSTLLALETTRRRVARPED